MPVPGSRVPAFARSRVHVLGRVAAADKRSRSAHASRQTRNAEPGTRERANAGTRERANAGTRERGNAGTRERANAGTRERAKAPTRERK